MKKICFFLLVMILPLQSLWAATESCHPEDSALIILEIVHSHDHETHEHLNSTSGETTPCDADHCHAHGATVLPSHAQNAQPDLRYNESTPFTSRVLSKLTNRIERPKWC